MGSLPDVGQIVAVRQRLYLVEQSIPPVNPGDSTLVRLSCVDDDAQGQTLDVLWEIEPDARAHKSDRWHGLGTREIDDPALFAAYVNTLRWNCVTATDATLLQAPFRAGTQSGDLAATGVGACGGEPGRRGFPAVQSRGVVDVVAANCCGGPVCRTQARVRRLEED